MWPIIIMIAVGVCIALGGYIMWRWGYLCGYAKAKESSFAEGYESCRMDFARRISESQRILIRKQEEAEKDKEKEEEP